MGRWLGCGAQQARVCASSWPGGAAPALLSEPETQVLNCQGDPQMRARSPSTRAFLPLRAPTPHLCAGAGPQGWAGGTCVQLALPKPPVGQLQTSAGPHFLSRSELRSALHALSGQVGPCGKGSEGAAGRGSPRAGCGEDGLSGGGPGASGQRRPKGKAEVPGPGPADTLWHLLSPLCPASWPSRPCHQLQCLWDPAWAGLGASARGAHPPRHRERVVPGTSWTRHAHEVVQTRTVGGWGGCGVRVRVRVWCSHEAECVHVSACVVNTEASSASSRD